MSQNTNTQIQWLKRFASDKPVIFSMLVILAAGLLTEIPFGALFEPWVGNPGAEFLRVVIGHTLTGLILVGLLVKLGLFRNARFTPPSQWKALWLTWPFAIFTLLNLDSLIAGDLVIDTTRPGLIILYTFMTLTIGFCEEVMGRGVVLSVLLQKWGHSRRGIYLAVLVSGALFGAAHIFNLLANRLPLLANLTQIGYSFAFGVLFAACFLRNNAIWPMIIMHAAVDFAGGLRDIAVGGAGQFPVTNNTPMEALVTLCIVALPTLLYGLWILRKVAPPAERVLAVEAAADYPSSRNASKGTSIS
ncbi:MAG TPA: CPBP family intramembrane metalloprotease [Anaerolineae bacterium]|nr:CPBP family intramembrane metalloprotease [Anaerolineae bacterium]